MELIGVSQVSTLYRPVNWYPLYMIPNGTFSKALLLFIFNVLYI